MTPEELSRKLRRGTGEHLRRRRAVVAWSLLGTAAMGPIVLDRTGLIGHVLEPPLPGLDADKIDASGEAYALLQTPDAVLGIGSNALTMALAAGGDTRATERPWLPLALAGKVAIDVAVAAKPTVDQWTKHRAFCSWCLLGGGAASPARRLSSPRRGRRYGGRAPRGNPRLPNRSNVVGLLAACSGRLAELSPGTGSGAAPAPR